VKVHFPIYNTINLLKQAMVQKQFIIQFIWDCSQAYLNQNSKLNKAQTKTVCDMPNKSVFYKFKSSSTHVT